MEDSMNIILNYLKEKRWHRKMVLRDSWDSMDGGGASVVTNGPAGIVPTLNTLRSPHL